VGGDAWCGGVPGDRGKRGFRADVRVFKPVEMGEVCLWGFGAGA